MVLPFSHPIKRTAKLPVTYEILSKPDVVVARYRGAVSLVEAREMFAAYKTGDDFRLSRPHIVDVAEVNASDIGFTEIFSLFGMFEASYRGSGETMRVAIVAQEDLAFGMSRIFENLAEPSDWAEVQMFDTLEAATDWLASLE